MTVPDELKRSTPRPVSLTVPARRAILGRCGSLVLIVALSVWAGRQTHRESRRPTADLSITVTAQGAPRWLHWEGDWPAGVGLLLAAMIGAASIRRQRQFLMYGRAAVATVIADVTPFWYRFRRSRRRPRMRRLQCEYRLLSGKTLRTTVSTQDRALAKDSEIVVLYDPDQPERALYYRSRLLKIDSAAIKPS